MMKQIALLVLLCCGSASTIAAVAEVITIALHEICHHVLGEEYPKMNTRVQHYYIYKVQIEVQNEIKKVADDPYSLKWSIVMRLKWVECYWLPKKLK